MITPYLANGAKSAEIMRACNLTGKQFRKQIVELIHGGQVERVTGKIVRYRRVDKTIERAYHSTHDRN